MGLFWKKKEVVIKHRKSIGGYILDSLVESSRRKHEKRMMEKDLRETHPEVISCDDCGKTGTIAKCSNKTLLSKCDNRLCKSCAQKCKDCKKHFCSKHINKHKCK